MQKQVNTAEWDDIWLRYHAVNIAKVKTYFKMFDFFKVPKSSRIVDIGCGSGEALKLLKQRGYKHLKGVEPEKRLFAKNNLGMILQGDCLKTGLREQYDVVLIFGVLHHLHNMKEIKLALQNVKKTLRKGGRFYSVEQYPNLVRSIAMKLVRDTPVGLLHPTLRMERVLLRLERKEPGHWLEVEHDVTKYAQSIGLKVVFHKKDIRYRYIIFEKVRA